jgi:hypothetical protein
MRRSRPPWPTAIVAALLGCGSGGGDTPDASDGPPVDPRCAPDRPPSARFTVVSEPGAGARVGTQASGQVLPHPGPQLAATLVTEGACRFVGPRPALCAPACTGDQVCDVDGQCVAFAEALPAGELTIDGTNPPLRLTPRAGNGYYTDRAYPGLFAAGDELVLALAGDGPVAPLTATVRGVPPLAMPTTALVAREHQPLTVAWTPITTPAEADVLLHFDNDHHGVTAYLECVAPAAAGSLTIPAAILDPLIEAGETGIGTYIENAWLEVHHQVKLETPRGCAIFESYADQFVSVDTIRAP